MTSADQLLLPGVESAEPLQVRWESPTRYYAATLRLDLLGDWVLTVARGGKRNRLGAVKHNLMLSREVGEQEIAKIGRRRLTRGYAQLNTYYRDDCPQKKD